MSQNANLFSLVRARWTDLEKPAIETPDGKTYRYRDLLALSGRMANALGTASVKPGDRVAVQVDKSPEALILYLACLRSGAAYLPLNTAYTPAEIEYFLADAEPTVFVCGPDREAAFRELTRKVGVPACLTLGTSGDGTLMALASSQSEAFDDAISAPGDLATILYTSGTTGRSKGAMLTHRNLSSNADVLRRAWQFTADDVLLHALPLFHAHGLFVASNVTLMAGATMLLPPRFDVDEIFRLFPRATVFMGVPTFYTRLLDDPRLSREAVRHMRLFVSGSAPLLAETHRAFAERTGHAILERYGMTETVMNASNPYEGERVPGTVGPPLEGVEIRVADTETKAPLSAGEIGMIEVRGPNVFKGYWRMPEKTKAEFTEDGFFITGDLGLIDERGYVHIVGRSKDLVITGGYNVYPKEIEREIDALPGVRESAVIGVPHPDFGEGVVAVVAPGSGARLDEADIVSALKPRLANYKLPKKVVFLDELPRNTMGKVQKNVLRETFGGLFDK